MNKKYVLILIATLLSSGVYAQNILTYINTATDFFNKLDEGKYTEAQNFFDVSVKDKIQPENLEKMWAQLQANLGKLESVDGAQNKAQDEYQIVILNCKFTKDTQPFQFIFNKDQKLVGFFILPKKAMISYKLPIYADTTKIVEKLITIISGTHNLPAMLTLPKDSVNCPVVVFVHGSGPSDMDESVGAQKPFKDLALGLAAQGIASVRYVKRTAIYGQEFTGVFTTKEEVTEDALAVLAFTKTIPQIDSQKVYLFGHSLGGMLASKIATLAPDLKGIIIAAAPARKLQDISIDQNNYLFNLQKDTTKLGKEFLAKATKDLLASKTITKTNFKADSVVLGLPASYWADLNTLDQVALTKKLTQRIFIIQGGQDFQVTEKDYNLWTIALKGKRNVDAKLYPMLNHLFSFVSEKGTTAQYEQPGNVDQPVVDDLASWILGK
jgi:pimeloyl-ACP methyl ester carboxylesterase